MTIYGNYVSLNSMNFCQDVIEAQDSTLIDIAIAAESVDKPYRLYYGESDMPTPDFISRAAAEAINEGHTHYTATPGYRELRDVIAEKYFKLHGVQYNTNEVMATIGAGMAIFLGIRSCISAGDNAIVISPAFSLFGSIVQVFGGEVREAPLIHEGNQFRLDLDRLHSLIDSRTRLLVVNSPSNPTGWMISRKEQEALWELALRHDFMIMSDEVYDRIVFDPAIEVAPSFARIATDRDHLLVVNSFSKTYNMTGWRLGYALGSERLIQLMSKVGTLVMCSPPAMIQRAGIAAMREGEPFIHKLREQYQLRRSLTLDALSYIPGLSVPLPQGAFYVFPKIEGLTDSMKFTLDLLNETHVGIGPGSAFGNYGEGYVRISFASSETVLRPALRLFADYLRAAQK